MLKFITERSDAFARPNTQLLSEGIAPLIAIVEEGPSFLV